MLMNRLGPVVPQGPDLLFSFTLQNQDYIQTPALSLVLEELSKVLGV